MEELPFQLEQIITETFELFTAKSQQLGLALTWELDPSLPEVVVGDGLKLRQVLINLVGNAVKFTSQGSIHVKAKQLAQHGDTIKVGFSVKDTGVGIPEEKLPLLFQPFSQVDTSLTRKYGGTGLGLAICKNLVELMNGTIHVETNEQAGVTFRFTVTVKPCSDPACLIPKFERTPLRSSEGKQEKIPADGSPVTAPSSVIRGREARRHELSQDTQRKAAMNDSRIPDISFSSLLNCTRELSCGLESPDEPPASASSAAL